MQTLILPGFSPGNRKWVDDIASALSSHFPAKPVYWSHWQESTPVDLKDFNLPLEEEKVTSLAGDNVVNIIAKSISTFLTVYLLKNNSIKINKVILCGIPINALTDEQKTYYQVLQNFSDSQVEIIHNQSDVVGSAGEIQEFIHSINPKLGVLSKPRSDHSYPYPEDFINFLQS